MQYNQPLKRRVLQINRASTFRAEMPKKGVPRFGCRVGVLLDLFFALGEGEFGFQDTVVVGKG